MTPHNKRYCDMCRCNYIECGYCGNNCCNAGTGQLSDGSNCGCKEAYEMQAKMWAEESRNESTPI